MAARNATVDDVTVEDAEQAIRAAEPTLPVLPNFLLPNAVASLVTTTADFGRFMRHMVTAPAAGGAPAAIATLMYERVIRAKDGRDHPAFLFI